MNFVYLCGNLAQAVEMRASNDGTAIAKLRMATDRKTRDGKQITDWHSVVAFGQTAEGCAGLGQGARLTVRGSVRTRSYTGADGQKRYVTEVVADDVGLFASKRQTQSAPEPQGAQSAGAEPWGEQDERF